MAINILKTSFTGGEIAPSLYGRTDLEMYQNAVREMTNFIIHPHGGTSNRPGTEFIGEVKDSSAVTRLISFQFSITQSYIIEVGNLYMRFYKNQGRVVEADQNITDITQANPAVVTLAGHGYTDGDWTPIYGVVGMNNINGKMFKVANATANTFELTDIDDVAIDSTLYTAYTSGGVTSKIYEIATTYTTDDIPLLKIVQSADVLYITHPSYPPRKVSRTGHTAWLIDDITFQSSVDAPTGETMVGTANEYVITAIVDDEESLPSAIVEGDDGETLTWTDPTGIDYWNVYKDGNASGTFGWIGQANTNSFEIGAGGYTEDVSKTPPTSKNPFDGVDNYPGTAMFFEQRLVFARTNNNPQTIWGSSTGYSENMNKSVPARDDDAYKFTINSQQVNEIKWMLPLEVLILGTSGAEWKINAGSQSDSITPSSVLLRPQSQWGCSDIQPLQIGNTILFIEGSGKTIRDMAYSLEVDGYAGNNLVILANHLFRNRKIKEWAYEQDPDSIVWCVMSDGELLGLTYFKEHKVWGWHKHETQGIFESVASITTEAGVDEAWMIVKRTINGVTRRYIELMKDRVPTEDVKDSWFVDSGLQYNSTPTNSLSGLEHLEGKDISVLADGNVITGITVTDGKISLPVEASIITLGLGFESVIETLDVEFATKTGQTILGSVKDIKEVTILLQDSRALWVGPQYDRLTEIPFRTTELYGEPIQLYTGTKDILSYAGNINEGRLYMKNIDPVPVTILSMEMKVEYGNN